MTGELTAADVVFTATFIYIFVSIVMSIVEMVARKKEVPKGDIRLMGEIGIVAILTTVVVGLTWPLQAAAMLLPNADHVRWFFETP